MESYQGVKFNYQQTKPRFSYDQRLERLNYWATLLSQLGLAPLHADGAYGNHSYRTGTSSFVITKSAMTPCSPIKPDNFCKVLNFDDKGNIFNIEGNAPPSSESFLHHAIYQSLPHIHSILHGHCSLLNDRAKDLDIPVTREFHDYGTQELANSALELLKPNILFFILKDHGFVSLGKDIDQAGQRTLTYYSKLISLLQSE